MIRRIVRMSFKPEHVEDFVKIFNASKDQIRQFEGCQYLSLHQDHHHPEVYYTFSHWNSQHDLDQYRHSDLFQSTWAKTKILFNDKPLAYSLDLVTEVI